MRNETKLVDADISSAQILRPLLTPLDGLTKTKYTVLSVVVIAME